MTYNGPLGNGVEVGQAFRATWWENWVVETVEKAKHVVRTQEADAGVR